MGSSVEIRAQIDTETVRGLQFMNGGSAAALTAMLPSVLQNPGFRPLAVWMIAAICCAGVGLAAAIFHNRLRRKCSLQYDKPKAAREPPYTNFFRRFTTEQGEPRVCTRSIMWMWASFVLFLTTIALVAIGGWSVVRLDIPATFSCWELKEVGGHTYKFNSCSGILGHEDLGVVATASTGSVANANAQPLLTPQPSAAAAPRIATPASNHVDVLLARLSDFANEYGIAITALATVLLTLVTTGLVWMAYRQIVTSRAQLRAYVSVESSSISLTVGSQPVAGVTLKNYGNTPAYEFTINSGLGMAESFDKLQPPPPEQKAEPLGVLSPGATAVLVRTADVLIHPDHLAMLADGRSAIFVYGEVTYVDAFKKRRVLKYRLMTGGNVGFRGNALVSCEKGNDAD
jgi:hypothetical protein